MDTWDIRYTQVEDKECLLEWLSDVEDSRWFPMSSKKEIEDAARNWIGFSKYYTSLTATIKDNPCAIGTLFLMPYRKVAHHCSFYVIVDKKYRRQGVGFSLVKNLLNLAKNYFRLESVLAEVYRGCPIASILDKLNFQCFASQEKFVKEKDGYLTRDYYEVFLKEVSL